MAWSFLIQNLNDNVLIAFHSENSWVMLNQRFNRSCRFSICNIFQNEYLMTQLYGHSGKGLQNWDWKSKYGVNYKDRLIVEDWKLTLTLLQKDAFVAW